MVGLGLADWMTCLPLFHENLAASAEDLQMSDSQFLWADHLCYSTCGPYSHITYSVSSSELRIYVGRLCLRGSVEGPEATGLSIGKCNCNYTPMQAVLPRTKCDAPLCFV